MPEHPRPRLVVSRCLELAACRYDGASIRAPWVRRLEPHVELVPVCPEVEIGLGVPRDPVRLVQSSRGLRMIQPATGRDLTRTMTGFAEELLSSLGPVDGFLLKSRSPSCGVRDTKHFTGLEETEPAGRGPGLFARAVLERFGERAVEDEARLEDDTHRHAFLTRLFALARLRRLGEGRPEAAGVRDLQDFHAAHKLVLMAHRRTALTALGRLLADPAGRSAAEPLAAYRQGFAQALARPVSRGAQVDVLMHAMGYFKGRLTAGEKARFFDGLEEYRSGGQPLPALLATVRSWIDRFGQGYLAAQVYFDPYPRSLLSPAGDEALGQHPGEPAPGAS